MSLPEFLRYRDPDEQHNREWQAAALVTLNTPYDHVEHSHASECMGEAAAIFAALPAAAPAPRICPDCGEPIVDVPHWHEEKPAAAPAEGLDAQTADLLAALADLNIHSRFDLEASLEQLAALARHESASSE